MVDDYPPDDPQNDLPFLVRFGEYPGGSDQYWRDYGRALRRYFRAHDWEYEPGESPATEVKHHTYYALRSRAYDLTIVVADAARSTRQSVAIWLVNQHGFPWRNDCDEADLRRIICLLEKSDILTLVPQSPAGATSGVEDEFRPYTPFQIREVLLRHAHEQIDAADVVRLLRPTMCSSHGLVDPGSRDPYDAAYVRWPVLQEYGRSLLGESEYTTLLRRLNLTEPSSIA